MLRRIKTARRDTNRYWSDMALKKETAVGSGDNRKLFHLLHKATKTNSGNSEMIWNDDVCLLKTIKDHLLRQKEFFVAKPRCIICYPRFNWSARAAIYLLRTANRPNNLCHS